MAPWRDAALKRGYRSSASVPLPLRYRRTVMNLYASEPYFFGEQEVRLLERLAETLGIAHSAIHEEQRRHEVEKQLRESEERYRRIVETTSEGVLTTDARGRISFVNQRMADMLGYLRDEMVGHVVFDFFDEEARLSGLQRFERRRQGVAEAYEQRYRHKDGRAVWTLVSATPLVDAHGAFEGTIGMVTDVSEQRRERSESEALFGMSLDIMCVSSMDGHFKRVNASVERILGHPVHEVAEWSLLELVHPEDLAKTHLELDKLRRGESSAGFEIRCLCRDGSYRLLSWNAVPADGVVYAVARDATAQRQLEEQLRQSQKMEAIGTLAGGIAHDFNNVLSVMLGYTGLALQELPQGNLAREDIEEVEKAAHRASALTRQLLAFSRRQILEPQVVDLRRCVLGLDMMLSRLLGEQIELALHLDGRSGHVYADPTQIEQVIMNLVLNARDAMPNGGCLTIASADVVIDEAHAVEYHGMLPGPYVMLSVSDTGTGMNDQTMRQIFEPFFTTKKKGRGTGLGLSTVYGIIKQSGGHVAVTSRLGAGTTFKVFLPLTDRPFEVSVPSGSMAASLQGRETILLAEDDDAVRKTLRAILDRHGYQVLEAINGEDALLRAGQHKAPIHMLLTDVVMPHMNGRQLADQLLRTRPDVQVLYLSGYTDDAIVHHGVLDVGIRYLAKPVSPDALLKKVREILDSATL